LSAAELCAIFKLYNHVARILHQEGCGMCVQQSQNQAEIST